VARSGKSEQRKQERRRPRPPLPGAIWLIQNVCRQAGSSNLVASSPEIQSIIERSDTAALFDWLIIELSYQGISDRVAAAYLQTHGSITWVDIGRSLLAHPPCPKLKSYWHFQRCGYTKSRATCSQPEHYARCPLPKHRLRNGRLNQTAYSLYLFIRDVADRNLIGWIDQRLSNPPVGDTNHLLGAGTWLLAPLRHVYGVADKVLSMTFATILLSAGPTKPSWRQAGGKLIAVDTLVHNFLHRTGLIRTFGSTHQYGPRCYGAKGCSRTIERLARHINARGFSPAYARYFPRFVQHAIWRYCAQDHLNVCNGNQIDDRKRCDNRYCALFESCQRRRPHTTI
jgi:hypothetical protein